MKNKSNEEVKILNRIEKLIEHMLAVQLYQHGLTQQAIAKHLRIAKAKVNDLLKGVEKQQ